MRDALTPILESKNTKKDDLQRISTCLNYNLNKFSEKFVVIATQGNSDLVAITESLKIKATYIGLVASKKKFQALKKKITDDGISQEKLKDIICPAGIFINAIMPEEVALSIFAEIIELKRSGKIGSKKF